MEWFVPRKIKCSSQFNALAEDLFPKKRRQIPRRWQSLGYGFGRWFYCGQLSAWLRSPGSSGFWLTV